MLGILAEMGEIDCFDAAREFQRLSRLGLVCNRRQVRISHKGYERLRYRLFQGAMSVVSHNKSSRQPHHYYKTKAVNPPRKMPSLNVIACKLLRILFTILKKGLRFNPWKTMQDIVHPSQQKTVARAQKQTLTARVLPNVQRTAWKLGRALEGARTTVDFSRFKNIRLPMSSLTDLSSAKLSASDAAAGWLEKFKDCKQEMQSAGIYSIGVHPAKKLRRHSVYEQVA